MRKSWIETASLVVFVAAVSFCGAQPPTPKNENQSKEKGKTPPKTKLEEMLEQALLHNPDIRVAEAKVRGAEAELNRARLLVTQKVVTLNAALEVARANVAAAEARLRRVQQLFKANSVSQDEIETTAAALQQAKAELAKLEAEAPYITGQPPKDANVDPAVQRGLEWLHKQRRMEEEQARLQDEVVRTRYAASLALAQQALEAVDTGKALKVLDADKPAADKLRAALNKSITMEFQSQPLDGILGSLNGGNSELPIQVKGNAKINAVVSARFKDVPLAVVLEWLEDALPNHKAYVRDYGVLFVPADQRPPNGAVPLRDFWKGEKPDAKKKADKN